MLFWNRCHSLSLELSTLSYALMNSIVPYTNQVLPLLEQLAPWTRDRVKLLQSPYFFRPLHPTHLTPSPLPTVILYSPQIRSHQETKMAAHRTQRSTSTISRKNRGLWTVFSVRYTNTKLSRAYTVYTPVTVKHISKNEIVKSSLYKRTSFNLEWISNKGNDRITAIANIRKQQSWVWIKSKREQETPTTL